MKLKKKWRKKRERNFEEKKSKRKKKITMRANNGEQQQKKTARNFVPRPSDYSSKLGGNGWVIYDRFPQHAHAFLSLFRRSAVYCRVKFQNPAYIIAKGGSNAEKLLKYWTCVKRRIWNVNFFMLRFALALFALSRAFELFSLFHFQISRSRAHCTVSP